MAALLYVLQSAAAASCDIYAAGGMPCVAAHSLSRALYSQYAGPLYRVVRSPGNASLDIGLRTPGGAADSAVHDSFCGNSTCTVERTYDQSPLGNHLGIGHGPSFLNGPRGAQDRGVNFADRSRPQAILGGRKVYAAYFAGTGTAPHGKEFAGQGYSNRTAVGTAECEESQTIYAGL